MKLPASLTKYTKIFRRIRYGENMQPVRDWLLVLAVALIALVASVLFNVGFFLDVVSGENEVQSQAVQETVDTSAVDRVQEVFIERANESARYQGEYQFVDPSR